MYYDTLAYFKTAAEELNLTRAAEKLHLTQQALSMHISKLEREYHSRFFERVKSGLALTPAGERFYEFALRVLELERDAAKDIGGIRRNLSGSIAVGTTMTRAVTLLPEFVARFAISHPSMRVKMNIASSLQNELESRLLHHELDAIIVPLLLNVPPTITVIELFKSYACLSVPSAFIETILSPGETSADFAALSMNEQKQRILDAKLFDRIPFVYANRFLPRRARQFIQRFAPNNPISIDLGDYENLFSVAFCGHAAVFTDDTLARQSRAAGQFVYPLKIPESPIMISVCYRNDASNHAARLFVEELVEYAKLWRAPPPEEFFATLD